MENKKVRFSLKRKVKLIIGLVVRSLAKRKTTLSVEIPKGFYNCDVSTCNHFIADTNDSSNWKTLKFPLPKPKGKKWEIANYDILPEEKTIVKLVTYSIL